MSKLRSLLFWYIPILAVQMTSSWVTVNAIAPWYQSLNKASWTPPGWLFGPVWSMLYIMIAVAIWRVFHSTSSNKQRAYALFWCQLLANGLWSIFFFGLQQPLWALADLTLLIILIAMMFRAFLPIDQPAALLLIPYFVWSLYALTLNAAICWLN